MWKYLMTSSIGALLGMGTVFVAAPFEEPICFYVWAGFGVLFLSVGMVGLGMWWQERLLQKNKR